MAAKDKNSTNRPVRVEDVARVAGVSPITVSRALSHPEKVKEETRKRVAEAVTKTGYVVNSFASSLRSGRSSIITVFVSSLLNPHFANSMQGLVDALEGSRYHLMFAPTAQPEMPDLNVVNAALPFRPAGVVFTQVLRSETARQSLKQLGIPIMELWSLRSDPIDMLIAYSNHECGRLMGEHLGSRGYRRVAYAGHTQDRGVERLEGLRQGLAVHGAELVRVVSQEGDRSIPDGVAALDAVRSGAENIDAVFFGSDLLASGAMLRAAELGLDVPGDIAIAGNGDLDFTAHMRPPLTTVRIPSYDMGLAAGRMLLRRLDGHVVDEPVQIMPISLKARQST